MQNGRAQILLTGVAVNLLNMRPEICTLLLIKDAEWWKNHSRSRKVGDLQLDTIRFVDEFKSPCEIQASGRGETRLLTLPDDLALPDGKIRPQDITPPGAAALYLGLEAAKGILSV